jgi:hypothetical protein
VKETHEMNLNSVLQPGIDSNCKQRNKERKFFGGRRGGREKIFFAAFDLYKI